MNRSSESDETELNGRECRKSDEERSLMDYEGIKMAQKALDCSPKNMNFKYTEERRATQSHTWILVCRLARSFFPWCGLEDLRSGFKCGHRDNQILFAGDQKPPRC
jgi:hypothetical protein